MADGEIKPSKATQAAVYEFGIRWPCPVATDPERYDARLRMLARDCAELSPGLLRKAGDRVARIPGRPSVLASASELHQAANEIIAERAIAANAEKRAEAAESGRPMAPIGDKAAAYARANLEAIRKGMKVMQTDEGEVFRLGDHGEKRAVRRDGSAIVPFFRQHGEVEGVPCGWYVKRDDADVLAVCYRQYGAKFTAQGGRVMEITL